ncbi:unnamed protein product [Brassica oleracea var. botrytis]
MSGTAEDIYKIGKTAATEHYRAIFQIVKDHDKENNKRHKSEIEKHSISDQIEFLEEIMEKRVSCFNIVEEKDKIEVPYIDWDKLGEPFMSKPLVAPPPLSKRSTLSYFSKVLPHRFCDIDNLSDDAG